MYKVVVIGTGTMGVGIAAHFIAVGAEVVLLGRSVARAEAARSEIDALVASMDVAPQVEKPARVATGEIYQWRDWNDVDWVIETVSERLDLKQEIFAWLDRSVPAGIPIGSNSSGFPISKIASGLHTANRMFNAHYFMPAHMVPLVEIVLGEQSDGDLAEQVCQFYRDCGKKPVLVRQDIPGFLANRMQHALMREALSLVEQGIATPDDIDLAVQYSFGFRYAAVGPMTQKEISGWEGMTRAATEIYPSLSNIIEPPRCITDLVSAGKTGIKAGEGFRKWSLAEGEAAISSYQLRLKAAFDVLNLEPSHQSDGCSDVDGSQQ